MTFSGWRWAVILLAGAVVAGCRTPPLVTARSDDQVVGVPHTTDVTEGMTSAADFVGHWTFDAYMTYTVVHEWWLLPSGLAVYAVDEYPEDTLWGAWRLEDGAIRVTLPKNDPVRGGLVLPPTPATIWLDIVPDGLSWRGWWHVYTRARSADAQVPTRPVIQELAWMLQRGTLIEREWADDALARLPPAVRDQVEEAREGEPAAPSSIVRSVGESTASAPTRVRVTCVLVRAGKNLFREIGVTTHDHRLGEPDPSDRLLYLDVPEAKLMERATRKSQQVLKRWTSETVQPLDEEVELAIDERAVLHFTTRISQDRRHISIEGRAHAKDSDVLLFVPRFNAKVQDGGGLWIPVRNVIVGKPSPDHGLEVLLRMKVITVGGDAGR